MSAQSQPQAKPTIPQLLPVFQEFYELLAACAGHVVDLASHKFSTTRRSDRATIARSSSTMQIAQASPFPH